MTEWITVMVHGGDISAQDPFLVQEAEKEEKKKRRIITTVVINDKKYREEDVIPPEIEQHLKQKTLEIMKTFKFTDQNKDDMKGIKRFYKDVSTGILTQEGLVREYINRKDKNIGRLVMVPCVDAFLFINSEWEESPGPKFDKRVGEWTPPIKQHLGVIAEVDGETNAYFVYSLSMRYTKIRSFCVSFADQMNPDEIQKTVNASEILKKRKQTPEDFVYNMIDDMERLTHLKRNVEILFPTMDYQPILETHESKLQASKDEYEKTTKRKWMDASALAVRNGERGMEYKIQKALHGNTCPTLDNLKLCMFNAKIFKAYHDSMMRSIVVKRIPNKSQEAYETVRNNWLDFKTKYPKIDLDPMSRLGLKPQGASNTTFTIRKSAILWNEHWYRQMVMRKTPVTFPVFKKTNTTISVMLAQRRTIEKSLVRLVQGDEQISELAKKEFPSVFNVISTAPYFVNSMAPLPPPPRKVKKDKSLEFKIDPDMEINHEDHSVAFIMKMLKNVDMTREQRKFAAYQLEGIMNPSQTQHVGYFSKQLRTAFSSMHAKSTKSPAAPPSSPEGPYAPQHVPRHEFKIFKKLKGHGIALVPEKVVFAALDPSAIKNLQADLLQKLGNFSAFPGWKVNPLDIQNWMC
jgi:hypothetical protein